MKKSKANIFYLIKKVFSENNSLIFLVITDSIFFSGYRFIPLLILPYIINALLIGDMKIFLIFGIGYFLFRGILSEINKRISGQINIKSREINCKFLKEVHLKPLKIEYEKNFDSDFKNDFSYAVDVLNYECNYSDIIDKIKDFFNNIFSVASSISIISMMIFAKPNSDNEIINFWASPEISLTIILGLLIFSGIIFVFSSKKINKLQKNYFKEHSIIEKGFAYYRDKIVHNFNDYGLFRIFNMQNILENKIKQNANDNASFFKRNDDLNFLKLTINAIVSGLITLVSYTITTLKIISNAVSIELLLTYSNSLILLSESILSIIKILNDLKRQIPYFEYLENFLNQEEQKNGNNKNKIPDLINQNYELKFENVSYKYPEKNDYVLNNLSFTFKSNKKYALVGENGAGKTTIVSLISRMIKPTSGRILLNNIDINTIDFDEYMSLLSFVIQDFNLFSATVGENVSCKENYEKTKVISSLKKSGLELKNNFNLNTKVYYSGENSKMFSGGESQKISIARAFFKSGDVFITDEPTSSLDPISELEIYNKLINEVNNKFVILITHRMSSCKDCEEILVIDKGKIIEKGNHVELIQKEGVYFNLWNSQAKLYNIL